MAPGAHPLGKVNGTTAEKNDGVAGGGATTAGTTADEKTDYSRWRLKVDDGRQTWEYLETDEEMKAWPQTVADKHHLGLPTGLPDLPPAKTPLAAASNAMSYFSRLQLPEGNWACEYSGPMFLLPCLVVAWYVTETPVPAPKRVEIKNYLFARQHPVDGGWGLHTEGDSSVFGTSMNYVVLRLLGADAEDPRMIKARGTLHKMGGALNGPHWSKFLLAVLGVASWDLVNPVPAELWLLPDWVPFAPWRWWVHMRQVFLPMSYTYSKKWSYPLTPLTAELRKEMYVQPYESINFASHRNDISPLDNYHPKSWVLNTINWVLVNMWNPYLRTNYIAKWAEDWTWWLIQREDENSDYADLGPVNAPLNMLCCYIAEGPGSRSVRRHRERMDDFLWVKDEGMLMNGTNGVQIWDTSFFIQAAISCRFQKDPQWRPVLVKALEFLEAQQFREDCADQERCYRHPRKGAWGFSNRVQGYTVCDCTSEGVKSIMLLQNLPGYPKLLSDQRIKDAIDVILTMQNAGTGGCSSYEPRRGSEALECLNAAEVFGNIMVEYDYVECTTACVQALSLFSKYYPEYRTAEIRRFNERALAFIRAAQRPDGSWYGAWGICFSYAAMFALEALGSVGETYASSERVRRACAFFLDRQMPDGGWGESYHACETGVYVPHERTQVVQTAWVCIALMEAGYPDKEPIQKALRLIVGRQQSNGEWLQEAIEGVFNKSW
ncbi:terpenoid cyclases/protein prenyltransferase alpha-alpha toroid [Lineolata rhizophorae]|uniref:Terpene cyclase/mutase family member n=1 Tax=Lineolata rhizophorae TaxID=578093 RepID=A0A6A6NWP5_9PEZI|nr:terpenoid cyclases/protein prenyltransferase alpha-alpha toroid [Lineolata rhizophorae]